MGTMRFGSLQNGNFLNLYNINNIWFIILIINVVDWRLIWQVKFARLYHILLHK